MKRFPSLFALLLLAVALCGLCGCVLTTVPPNVPPTIDPPSDLGKTTLTAANQKSDDGKIKIDYSLSAADAETYERVSVQVLHGDLAVGTAFLDKNAKTATVDGTWGKLTLRLCGVYKTGLLKELCRTEVNVWADAYNVASLNATFPVVYFTLDMFSMGESEATPGTFTNSPKNLPVMGDIPTFVSLERTAAYDWSELPSGVYAYPVATAEENLTLGFHAMNSRIAAYIKELYEIHPASTFHLYCVDNYPELILRFFTAQGIPEGNYHATMISDGTATVAAFKKTFGGSDGKTVYDAMLTEWNRIKALAAAGDPDYLKDVYLSDSNEYSILANYALLIATEEPNVDWWCSRNLFTANTENSFIKDLISGGNDSGANGAGKQANLRIFGINDMLSILTAKQQTKLKALFHFDAEMFSAAEDSGKKILMVLGTATQYEGDLGHYLAALVAAYGEEYQIYYKGHPGYPTGLYAEKQALFETLGITDVEASIAAELIIFYTPEIYLAGYASTTYKSAAHDRFLVMFGKTKAEGSAIVTTDGYGDAPDEFYVMDADGKHVMIENDRDDGVCYFDITSHAFESQK